MLQQDTIDRSWKGEKCCSKIQLIGYGREINAATRYFWKINAATIYY